MAVLVLAEHDNKELTPGTLSTIGAAGKLGDDIHVLVAGSDCSAAAEQAATCSRVTRVLKCDDPSQAHGLAENLAPLIAATVKNGNYSHVLGPASFYGKNVMPRAAALLDVQQISDITGIEGPKTFVRPIYAGNAMATVESDQDLNVITIRSTNFDPVETGSGAADIEDLTSPGDQGLSAFVSEDLTENDRPDLGTSRIVISGGRGLGSKENFELLERIADKLGAAIGASRAAVDAGYVPNDYQVGQTGKVIAPDLYIAVGISGAIQHLAGMKDSKVIVAINKDPEAPIFSVADYGLTADLFEALPEMDKALD